MNVYITTTASVVLAVISLIMSAAMERIATAYACTVRI